MKKKTLASPPPTAQTHDRGTRALSRSTRAGAGVASAIFGLVTVFHVAVAAGAPFGEFTQGGANLGTLPAQGRVVAGVSAVVVLALAVALLGRAKRGPLRSAPPRLLTVFGWIATAYAGTGLVVNLLTPSAAERTVWVPVTLVLLTSCLVTMLSTRRQQ